LIGWSKHLFRQSKTAGIRANRIFFSLDTTRFFVHVRFDVNALLWKPERMRTLILSLLDEEVFSLRRDGAALSPASG
jgi:hypothetical protein